LTIQRIIDFKFGKTQIFFRRIEQLSLSNSTRNNFLSTNPFSTTSQLDCNSTNNYQPHYRTQGISQPRLVVYKYCEKKGHLKCECEIQVMIDRMKDLEFKLQEKKNPLHEQINAVDKPLVPKDELNAKEDKYFVDLDNNIEAYTIEL
jgi:hypothetical protein